MGAASKPRTPCRSLVASGHLDGQRASPSFRRGFILHHHGDVSPATRYSNGRHHSSQRDLKCTAPQRQLVGGEHLRRHANHRGFRSLFDHGTTGLRGRVFEWNLTVEVGNLDCTCFVSIEHIDEAGHHENWHVLLYLGTSHHRPVFLGEWNQHLFSLTSTEDASSSELITESSVIAYPMVLAPGSTSLTMVSAEVCEAPYGVCLAEPVVVNVPFELVDGDLRLTVAPGNMSMDEGVWNMAFTAVDEFLRSTGVQRTSFVYDASPPTVALVADSSVLEREEFNVYATIEDGYIGAEFTYTWTIVDDNDERPSAERRRVCLIQSLGFEFDKAGFLHVDVAVRDRRLD